jgi:hypothetical protein
MTLITKTCNENLVMNLNLALSGRYGTPAGISFDFRSKTRLKVYSKVKVHDTIFNVINIQLIASCGDCKGNGYLYTVVAKYCSANLEDDDSFDLRDLDMEPVTILS